MSSIPGRVLSTGEAVWVGKKVPRLKEPWVWEGREVKANHTLMWYGRAARDAVHVGCIISKRDIIQISLSTKGER